MSCCLSFVGPFSSDLCLSKHIIRMKYMQMLFVRACTLKQGTEDQGLGPDINHKLGIKPY